MLVFYKNIDGECFYFTGRNSDLEAVLSIDIDDAMHFNECGYGFLKSMCDEGFLIMWGN